MAMRHVQMMAIKRVIDKTDLDLLDKQRRFLNEAIIALNKDKPLTAEHLSGLQNFMDALTDAIKDN